MAANLACLYTIIAQTIHISTFLVSFITLLGSRNANFVFLKMSNIGSHLKIQNGRQFSIFITYVFTKIHGRTFCVPLITFFVVKGYEFAFPKMSNIGNHLEMAAAVSCLL